MFAIQLLSLGWLEYSEEHNYFQLTSSSVILYYFSKQTEK